MFIRLISLFRNKYVYTTLAFLVWLIFFDNNSLIMQYQLTHDLSKLKNQREYYIQEIEKNRDETRELLTNTKTLEKFAREKYFMKKDDEDIFIVVKE